jgi:hypothetical protein
MSTALKFQYNDDIRRVNIPDKEKFNFEDLISKIQTIYKTIPSGWITICVKYLDDEGDLVTVTTTEELRESFFSFSKKAATLKFFISFIYPVVQEKEPVSCDTSECPRPMQKFRQLHALAIQHLDNKDYIAARECFLEQIQYGKNEWQTRIPYYNIACCESLLGNLTSAFEYLQKAVNTGFRNCKKMLTDPDLNNLREKSSENFQTLLDVLKKDGHSGRGCWRRKEAEENTNNSDPEIKKPFYYRQRSESEDQTGARTHCGRWRRDDQTGETHPWKKRFGGQGYKKWKEEQLEKQTEKQTEPVILPTQDKVVISEEPVIITAQEKVITNAEEPETTIANKNFGKRLSALEEMGFTDKGKNVKALIAANGNPRLAVSILLDQGQ